MELRVAASVAFLVSLIACGAAQPEPATSPGAGAGAGAESAPQEEPVRKFHALDLTSACPHDIHLWFGAHPGDGHGEAAVVASGATIPVPRQSDGTNMVWVVDDKGFGLASVNITKNMRHVRIDAACMKIDADSTR